LNDRSYPIYIGQGLLSSLENYVPLELAKRRCFVITDENVAPLYGDIVLSFLKDKAHSADMSVLPAGEQTKSFASYERVCEWLLENGLNRQSVIFAVGGGVIGDLAGFCAATAMRGVDFIQVPTTLLSQVDSSVGGKTGINITQGKNLVGAFYQPKAVICDVDTLSSLPSRELQAGYAEVLKYGLIRDFSFFEWLEQNYEKVKAKEPDALSYIIEQSCKAKADVVAEDEFENGVRALLNLGHTFGHALEAAAKYDGRLLHGEGVAIGMVLAARLSADLDMIATKDVQRIEDHIKSFGMKKEIRDISPAITENADDLVRLMAKDKKATTHSVNFILLENIGQAVIKGNLLMDKVIDVMKRSM
jgi:3-dehydroquinate synthase